MSNADESNPFAPIRAADYTAEQINDLWVELGGWIDRIIEPRSIISKYILGSKGSGKTHLLRHQSYPVARLRSQQDSGLSIVSRTGCLAIFLRTTNMDAARFDLRGESEVALQHLFSIHLELKLLDLVGEALADMYKTRTPSEDHFDDAALLRHLAKNISDPSFAAVSTLDQMRSWVARWLRAIDDATNAAAFGSKMELRLPFATGELALPVGAAIRKWNKALAKLNIVYVLDEIENLSEKQQQVVNTLVRYAEGRVTFRLTGRLYARKTLKTIGGGEENREGSEFTIARVDEILRGTQNYSKFAARFIAKRLGSIGRQSMGQAALTGFDPRSAFEEVVVEDYARLYAQPASESRFVRAFQEAFSKAKTLSAASQDVLSLLMDDFPPLLQRINVLLFSKKFAAKRDPVALARRLREEAHRYMNGQAGTKTSYAIAVGHWKLDVFAQLCRESKRKDAVLPYAGFTNFVTMSSHNPRNLLVLLGKVYEIAVFKEVGFGSTSRLSVEIQTEAAFDAARFCFEGDSNYGLRSDQAREATSRLAELLRTARYALNIPEVSPLAISFDNDDLSNDARETLENAFNYSLIFEVGDGRLDRNTQRIRRLVQLSPMLSPRWGLPIGRRGDISVSAPLLNAIFERTPRDTFELLVARQSLKWNNPFSPAPTDFRQNKLF